MSSYCEYAPGDPLHAQYHNQEYGFPLTTDAEFFERLVLEINQAGLSWGTILKKRSAFKIAFDQFDVDTVAAYTEPDRQRLLADAGIIRNRLKVDAAIYNAKQFQVIHKSHGSFKSWLDAHHPLSRDEWVKVFKKQFHFVGGEIVGELLLSTGYLEGSHTLECPIYETILKTNPPWLQAKRVARQ